MSEKIIVLTDDAPKPVGPYNVAVKANGFVYTAGQIPLNLEGKVVGTTVTGQTKQVLENLKKVLEAAGTSLENVVKTTVFLKDMNDFAAMNVVYAEFFEEDIAPARSAVEVARLPKDVLVEIEAVAVID